MGYSIEILNNIRANASFEYLERIPVATVTNLMSIGTSFTNYTPLYNEFFDALLNKIGKTIIEQKMFKNPLARFKAGLVDPNDIEEIFIEMAKAEGAYDPTGPNPLGRREGPDVKVAYHRQNRQDYYAISIGELDVRRAFRSEATLDTFIKGLINSVYSADEYDEYLLMSEILEGNVIPGSPEYVEGGNNSFYFNYEVPDFNNTNKSTPSMTKEEWAKAFVKILRKAVKDAKFPSTKYNRAGVMTWSRPEDLVLFISKDVSVEIDVERLATAFHQSETDTKVVPTIVEVEGFVSECDYALLVDKEFLRIYDTLITMRQQTPNAQGLFTNWFFHHHQIMSLSPFKTAIKFTSGVIG